MIVKMNSIQGSKWGLMEVSFSQMYLVFFFGKFQKHLIVHTLQINKLVKRFYIGASLKINRLLVVELNLDRLKLNK